MTIWPFSQGLLKNTPPPPPPPLTSLNNSVKRFVTFRRVFLPKMMFHVGNFAKMTLRTVCDRKGNSGRNRIAIVWPEPFRHPTKLTGFITGFDRSSSSVVLSVTLICNFNIKTL